MLKWECGLIISYTDARDVRYSSFKEQSIQDTLPFAKKRRHCVCLLDPSYLIMYVYCNY